MLCKYSTILKCVCTYNLSKEQYIRYWTTRYRKKQQEQDAIIKCCENKFKKGLIPTQEMIELVKKSKDRPKEKQKILDCLTKKIYYDNEDEEEKD